MALIARERDGMGQRIEVSLHDAMFSAIGARGMVLPTPERAPLDVTGFGNYPCQDGRCIHFAPVMPRFMDWFAAAASIQSWHHEGLFDRTRLPNEPALVDRLRERLAALFLTRTAAEWEDLAATAGVPLAVCRSMAEWMETPHARISGAVTSVDDPVYGAMLQPGPPVRLSLTPGRGGETRQENGQAPPLPRGALVGGALAGLRVLDLTQVWAGPTAARLLAEYGADVIKINSPHLPVLSHLDVNRGKRTILLDLATADDLAVFHRLAERADVVMQNFALGVADRLGVGYDAVRTMSPEIIYSSVSCYGYDGPWGGRRGYEVQGQATAGAQVQFGGSANALRLPYEINDYGTGILGAFATGLALFHRRRTGKGQRTEAALAYTATLHQSLYLQSYAAKSWDEPSGPDAVGTGPLHRLYQASDGWFFLGAHETQLAQLGAIPALTGHPGMAELAGFLEDRFATAPVESWVQHLVAAGLGAHRLRPVDEVMNDPRSVAAGFSLTREHPGVGMVRTIGPVPRLSRTPLIQGRPPPPPGSDGAAIRAELGLPH
jgi:crotonobetainyl-CoA:carnitine CoA-transferase CaiB-like acyl-CoA transferase